MLVGALAVLFDPDFQRGRGGQCGLQYETAEVDDEMMKHPARRMFPDVFAISSIAVEAPDWETIFPEVFSKEKAAQLPEHASYNHEINLEEGKLPPWGPIYKLSELELQALQEYLNEMLASGKIRPSKSSAGALILFVKKKDGSLRLCIDY